MVVRSETARGGVTLQFTARASVWMLVAEFAHLERLCEPTLGFALERNADSGAVRLHVTGSGATRFVRERWAKAFSNE